MIFTPKQYIWHAFGTLAVTAVTCAAASLLSYSSAFMDPFSQALNSFSFIDTYFYIENSGEDAEVDFNPDILLFDISGSNDRAEIAGKLQQITDLGPKVIGMDVIFGDNSTSGQTADDSLQRVVSRCPQLVTAKRITMHDGEPAVEHSFYTRGGGVDEACINIEDGVVRNFQHMVEVGGIKAQTFVDRILQRAYPDEYERLMRRGNAEERINYKGLMFMQLGMGDSLTADDVAGKVVLIGDFQDLRDFHNVPTTEGAASRIAGTRIHAYAISTFTMDRAIDKMQGVPGWLFGLVISYVFIYLTCVLFVECDKLSGAAIAALTVVVLLALSVAGGSIFINHRYELDLTVGMIGVGLASYTVEIWFWLCTTRPYRWLQKHLHLPDGGIRVYERTGGRTMQRG